MYPRRHAWLRRGIVYAPEVGFILRDKRPLPYIPERAAAYPNSMLWGREPTACITWARRKVDGSAPGSISLQARSRRVWLG